MEHRRLIGLLAVFKAFPDLDDGYAALLGFVGDREIGDITDVEAGSVEFPEEILDEFVSRFAVDGDIAVLIHHHNVDGLVEDVPLGSFQLLQEVSAGLQIRKRDTAVGSGDLLGVVVLSGQLESGSADAVGVGGVVFPQIELVVRSIDDDVFAVFKREYPLAVFGLVIDRDFSGGVTADLVGHVGQDVSESGLGLDHIVRTHFKVRDMDDAGRVGGEIHLDLGAVIGVAGEVERNVRDKGRLVRMSDDLSVLIKVKVAVDTLAVPEDPGVVLQLVHHDIAVLIVEVVTFSVGLADVDHAVLVDGDRHKGVIDEIIVYSRNLLKGIFTPRDIVEGHLSFRIRGKGDVYRVFILGIAPETEADARDRDDLARGLVLVKIDLQQIDVSDLAEADPGVVLMVERAVRELGIVAEFHGVVKVDIVQRDRVDILAVDSRRRLHIYRDRQRALRVQDEFRVGLRPSQVDGKRPGVLKSGIVRALRLRPDALREIVVVGDSETRDIEVFDLGIVQVRLDPVGVENAEIESHKGTAPVGRLVVHRDEVLQGVEEYHVLRPGSGVGGEMYLIRIVAAADRRGRIGIIGVSFRGDLLVKAKIARGKGVDVVRLLSVDELVVIGIGIQIRHKETVRDGSGAALRAAVVGISVADVRVSGLVSDGVEHVVTVFSDGVP